METTVPDQPSTRLKTIGYRFALLLTGVPSTALEIVRAVLATTAGELAQLRSRERRRAMVLRLVRENALKWREQNPPPGPETVFGRVAALCEPSRSVMALFLCLDAPVEDMELLLRLKHPDFIKALAQARAALFPGSAFPGKNLLREHRPWGGDRSKVAKAVAQAGENLELAAQVQADGQLHTEASACEIPREIVDLVVAMPGRPRLREMIFQPAVLAILLAIIVVLGTVVYLAKNRMGHFPGKDSVEEIVEHAGITGEYEPFTPVQAGKLDDWFLLKGFEGFSLPPQLEKAIAIGGRVYRYEGLLIAEVELKSGNARLLVFHLADLKTGPLEPGTSWRIFQHDDWAVAVTREGGNACLVLFEGDSDDMPAFLNSFNGKADADPAAAENETSPKADSDSPENQSPQTESGAGSQ